MVITAIGLMSGTSLDGVDIALIETDGKQVTSFGPSGYRPYSEQERELLRRALVDAVDLPAREARPGVLDQAEHLVTMAHAQAVDDFIIQHHLTREHIDIVGFHGQTVLHRPESRMTVQIGDGMALAKAIRIPVIHDFRAADVAAGGEGAPLVPVYHRALASSLARTGPIVIVNIGGVSNLTYISDDDTLIACDTGPGNALLDDFVFHATGQPFDNEGGLAARGKANEGWIASALRHSFFARQPPKSLDRNQFASLVLPDASVADVAATLTAFTVESIASVVPLLPEMPQSWIITGGGARNATMMQMLRRRLQPARVDGADSLGWIGDAIEAQAFAFLAARSLQGLSLSYPETTGVPAPMTGGTLVHP